MKPNKPNRINYFSAPKKKEQEQPKKAIVTFGNQSHEVKLFPQKCNGATDKEIKDFMQNVFRKELIEAKNKAMENAKKKNV